MLKSFFDENIIFDHFVVPWSWRNFIFYGTPNCININWEVFSNFEALQNNQNDFFYQKKFISLLRLPPPLTSGGSGRIRTPDPIDLDRFRKWGVRENLGGGGVSVCVEGGC